jgi:hypothetical protein
MFPTTAAVNTICAINPALCQQPTPIKINTNPDGTVIAQTGQTTLDKLLAALTTNLALIKGSAYIPTTQQPVQQPIYNPYVNPYPTGNNTSGTGATFGDSIEQFVTNNTGLILIGGAAFLLFKSGRK